MTQDDKDKTLWDAVTQDIHPLSGERKASPDGGAKAGQVRIMREILPSLRAETAKARTGAGLDGKTDERLRKGKMEIEGRLDLHGCRRAEAQERLTRTLTEWHKQGKRCVIVITGKGKEKPGEEDSAWWESQPGALRREVPEWLGQKPLSDIVLRSYPAQPRDGGDGALYVLLRRKR